MDRKQMITDYCRQFRTAGITTHIDQLIKTAETGACGYWEFTLRLLQVEAKHRHLNEVNRKQKFAALPKKQ